MDETKSRRNTGNTWSSDDIEQPHALAKANAPTGAIALKLGRSEAAIAAKAARLNISLAAANRPPYGTTT